jgi:hypothetical protein
MGTAVRQEHSLSLICRPGGDRGFIAAALHFFDASTGDAIVGEASVPAAA